MRFATALGCGVVLLASACESDPGRLVVIVNTDYAVPAEAGRLVVTTRDARGAPVDSLPFDLATEADADGVTRFSMPLSFVVVPLGGDSSRRAEIELAAWARDVDPDVSPPRLTTRRIVSGFTEGMTRVLPMFLARDCEGKVCAPDETCTAGGCQPAEVLTTDLSTARTPEDAADTCAPVLDGRTATAIGGTARAGAPMAVTPTDTGAGVSSFVAAARPGGDDVVVAGTFERGLQLPGGMQIGAPGAGVAIEFLFVATVSSAGVWSNATTFMVSDARVTELAVTRGTVYLGVGLGTSGSATFGADVRGGTGVEGTALAALTLSGSAYVPAWSDFLPVTGVRLAAGADDLYLLHHAPVATTLLGRAFDCPMRGFVARIAPSGSVAWGECAVLTGSVADSPAIAVAPDGSVFYSLFAEPGTDFGGGPRQYDFSRGGDALVKRSAAGDHAWDVAFVGAYVDSIAVDGGGAPVVVGTIPSADVLTPWELSDVRYGSCASPPAAHTTRLDSGGSVTWTRVTSLAPGLGSPSIAVTAGGDTYVSAFFGSSSAAVRIAGTAIPFTDGFLLLHIDPTGALRWAQDVQAGTPLGVAFPRLTLRADGTPVIAARFQAAALGVPAPVAAGGLVVAFSP